MKRSLLLALTLAAGCTQAAIGSDTDPLLQYPADKDGGYDNSTNGVGYGGGEVMTGDTNLHLIFYGHLPQASKDLVTAFATDLSGSPTANVLTTFGDTNGDRPSGHFKVDTRSLSASSFGATLDDNVFSAIVFSIDGLSPDQHGVYVFVSGDDVDAMHKGSSYCPQGVGGWHHGVTVGTKIARIAFIGSRAFCRHGGACTEAGPNGTCSDADHQAQVTWHEVAEAVSDPHGGAYTPEIGDLCEGDFHSDDPSRAAAGYVQLDLDYPAANGATANVHLGAHDYSLQPIWQNVPGGGCARRVVLQRPSVPLRGFPAGDLNFDSLGDLLMHNTDSGKVLTRQVDGFGNFGTAQVAGTVGPGAQILGVADFDGDGVQDILWRFFDGGRLTVWHLAANANNTSSTAIALSIPAEWAIKAVGDFDGNGFADILFLNQLNQTAKVWHNPGAFLPFTIDQLPFVSPHPAQDENLDSVGAGDIDGDGKSDILWRHFHAGSADTYRFWTFTSANSITSTQLPSSHFDYPLGMANIGGRAVLIAVSGNNVVWVDSAGGAHVVRALAGPAWRYSGASKFAGQPTLLWQNRTTGDVHRWLLTAGGVFQSTQAVLVGEDLDRQIIAY
jgi:hypothetical protein